MSEHSVGNVVWGHILPLAETPAPRPRPYLLRLFRGDVKSDGLIGPVVSRVVAMSKRFEGQGDLLGDDIWRLYAAKAPTLGLWAVLDDVGQIVGHILAQILPYNGRYVAWVTQVESDQVVSGAAVDDVIDTLEEWVREFNSSFAKDIKGLVTEMIFETARGDAWIRHSGWERYRTTFRRFVR